MRVRTAVGITAAIIVTQGVLTAFTLKAWHAIPGRHWPPNRWHIELGNLSEALAALASTGAALVALWAGLIALRVANRDRQDRKQERDDEEKTHARLVRLEAEMRTINLHSWASPSPVVAVKVRNFGPLPVIDVRVTSATWSEHPAARCRATNLARRPSSILRQHQSDQPYDEMVEFAVEFLPPTDEGTVIPVEGQYPGGQGIPIFAKIDLSKVVVKIQFTTANGVRWETPTKGVGTGETMRVKD